MNKCSYFIDNKAIFGSYPTQETVDELEKIGVVHFINLTFACEKKITPYTTNFDVLNFPIPDIDIPKNWFDFSIFLVKLTRIIKSLKKDEKIYVHCKGGHGRAGIVVACIFCYMFDMKPHESLKKTAECHSKRHTMREKWRVMGSPQTHYQKQFIHKFFRPINMNNIYIELDIKNNENNYQKVMSCVSGNDSLKSKLLATGLRPIVGCEPLLEFWLGKVRDELYYESIVSKTDPN